MFKKYPDQEKFESLVTKEKLYKLQFKNNWSIILAKDFQRAHSTFDLLSYYKSDKLEPFDYFYGCALTIGGNLFNYTNITYTAYGTGVVVYIGMKNWDNAWLSLLNENLKPEACSVNSNGIVERVEEPFYLNKIEKIDLPLYLNNTSQKLEELFKH